MPRLSLTEWVGFTLMSSLSDSGYSGWATDGNRYITTCIVTEWQGLCLYMLMHAYACFECLQNGLVFILICYGLVSCLHICSFCCECSLAPAGCIAISRRRRRAKATKAFTVQMVVSGHCSRSFLLQMKSNAMSAWTC